MTRSEQVMIRMTPITKEKLQKYADEDHRSLSSYIDLILEKHIEEKESV